MTRPDYWNDCTIECERAPNCAVCGRRKKPYGRYSRDNGLCDSDCEGYQMPPLAGHLWPGELAEMDADESMRVVRVEVRVVTPKPKKRKARKGAK